MLIIGERINASRKSIADAISSRNAAFIRNEAKIQAAAGADYIDANAGTFVGEEAKHLQWVIETIQEAVDLPLSIDSPDPAVIKAMIPLVKKTPMINSITLEASRLEGILPLVAEHKAKVIGLCQSGDSIADTAEAKVKMAGQLVKKVEASGVPLDHLYIDPLVYPLATDDRSALATLDAIETIMKEFPGVHTTCGLTNVSYGLPNRKLVNRAFLVAAIGRGLDSVILDPTDKQLFGALKAALTIAGKDEFCMQYIAGFREGRLE
ncbi:MAG: methyltetrahydrofolate--corrinoid methyltransferase [Deltaproteobacteria bacterium RBG_16_49_23]|nr:MAG: methyltetrahydrofolate--corrinoid methyltransferase [Deltaproteobacteria bacterium RBG_16_49_23]